MATGADIRLATLRVGFAAVWLCLTVVGAHPASAQTALFQKGDAVVSGFSGVAVRESGLAPGVNPIDQAFIDSNGASAQIVRIPAAGPARGQLLPASPVLQIKAGNIGQVFATTLDDAPVPNIYLGATSAYGLQIVTPAAGGEQRAKTGGPGVTWMTGQFGTTLGGGPGAIYKVDGVTGAATLFATVGSNSGPGIGDIVFDKATHQFFASDLDTGLIYRLSSAGVAIDTYDHGVAGLGALGLVGVPDDGAVAEIASPVFNSEDPTTWGYTPKARRIGGMAVLDGRLYYAVAEGPQVWSVGIGAGGFANDTRLEIDGTGLPATSPITDIAFDGTGRIYLAQRGDQRASYDYSGFAEPQKSSVIRFSPDPATGTWSVPPETYAVGINLDHRDADGGVDIGLGADGSCSLLWSTGDALAAGPDTVNGLQGNGSALIRSANVPPTQTYLVDYDGAFADPTALGHIGDVEVWSGCAGTRLGGLAPPAIGGQPYPTPVYPGTPGYPTYPPYPSSGGGLAIDKTAGACTPIPGGFACAYAVTVTNTDKTKPFTAPIYVSDSVSIPTAKVINDHVAGEAQWKCAPSAGGAMSCMLDVPPGAPTLAPGGVVKMHVAVGIYDDPSTISCDVNNVALVGSSVGAIAASPVRTATLPSNSGCKPTPSPTTGLSITKTANGDCAGSNDYACGFVVTITNNDKSAPYMGPIKVDDLGVEPGQPALDSTPGLGDPAWSCVHAGATNEKMACSLPAGAPTIPAGGSITLHVNVDISHGNALSAWCNVPNTATVTYDSGSATSATVIDTLPGGSNCILPPDVTADATPGSKGLSIAKTADPVQCTAMTGGYFQCAYKIRVTNTGTTAYTDPITVSDTTDYQFGNLGVDMSANPGWVCPLTSAKQIDCTAATPNLAPQQSLTLNVGILVSTTGIDLSSDSCAVPNNAELVAPAGGKIPVAAQLPPGTAGCFGPKGPPPETVPAPPPSPPPPPAATAATFTINKTGGQECTGTPVELGDGFDCSYLVTIVANQAYTGSIILTDEVLFAGAEQGVLPGCSGAAGTMSCPLPQASYVAGQSVGPLTITIHVPAAAVTPGVTSCAVENHASVTASDGTATIGPFNALPATDTLPPQSQCVPAPAASPLPPLAGFPIDSIATKDNTFGDLALEKEQAGLCRQYATGLWACDYALKVTNKGPGVFSARVEVATSYPAYVLDVTSTNSNCFPVKGSEPRRCYVDATLDEGGSTTLMVTLKIDEDKLPGSGACTVYATSRISWPKGGTQRNSNPDNDEQLGTDLIRPCPFTNIQITKTAIDDNSRLDIADQALINSGNIGTVLLTADYPKGIPDLTKTIGPAGCGQNPNGDGWICGFYIGFQNIGSQDFDDVIRFTESPSLSGSSDHLELIAGPGLDCQKRGNGTYDCETTKRIHLVGSKMIATVTGERPSPRCPPYPATCDWRALTRVDVLVSSLQAAKGLCNVANVVYPTAPEPTSGGGQAAFNSVPADQCGPPQSHNQHRHDNQPTMANTLQPCPGGTLREGLACVKSCDPGFAQQGNLCVASAQCPPGYQLTARGTQALKTFACARSADRQGGPPGEDQIQLSWAADGFGVALPIENPRTPITTPTSQGIGISKTADGTCLPAPGAGLSKAGVGQPADRGSYICSYTVTLTNTDPTNPFTGPLFVSDQSSFAKSNLASKEPGWKCDSPGMSALNCSIPSVLIGPNQSLPLHVSLTVAKGDLASAPCAVPNSASLITPRGATTPTITAALPTESGCGASAATRPVCPPGWTEVAVIRLLPKDWMTQKVTAGGQSITCGKPGGPDTSKVIKLAPVLTCPDGQPRGPNGCPAAKPKKTTTTKPALCPDGTPKPKNGVCPGQGSPIGIFKTCPNGQVVLLLQACPSAQLPTIPQQPGSNLNQNLACPDGQPRLKTGQCPPPPTRFNGLNKLKLLQPDQPNNGLH